MSDRDPFERYARVDAVLAALQEVSDSDDRAQRLDELCANDDDLRDLVRRMLAHEESGVLESMDRRRDQILSSLMSEFSELVRQPVCSPGKEPTVEATNLLMEEHRVIEKALDAMQGWTSKLGAGSEADDKAELASFVSFIQGFADAYHHGKEEDILFVAMGQHGFPSDAGPVAVMLHEHELGRSHVRALDGLARQTTAWSDDDLAALAGNMREFSGLLRQHIRKEDQILYPMADARLPDPVKEEMFRQFQAFEEKQTRSGERQRLRELADALIAAHAP